MLSAAPQLTLIKHAFSTFILVPSPAVRSFSRHLKQKDEEGLLGVLLTLEQSFIIWKVPLGFSFPQHSHLKHSHLKPAWPPVWITWVILESHASWHLPNVATDPGWQPLLDCSSPCHDYCCLPEAASSTSFAFSSHILVRQVQTLLVPIAQGRKPRSKTGQATLPKFPYRKWLSYNWMKEFWLPVQLWGVWKSFLWSHWGATG